MKIFNLFNMVVVRRAKPGETSVISWEATETHHRVTREEKLQVSYNPDTGRLLVCTRTEDDEYPFTLELFGTRLKSADENGTIYSGYEAHPDATFTAVDILLTRYAYFHCEQED